MNDCRQPIKTRIAYLAHAFPVEEEHYFSEEIEILRGNDIEVVMYSVLTPGMSRNLPHLKSFVEETVYLDKLSVPVLVRAALVCMRQWSRLKPLYARLFGSGHESLKRRMKGVLHTLIGVYFSELLKDQKVEHIHAHHGYLAAWVAMVAARMLDISYSITLHGSDLLIDRVFLDAKIRHCAFCFTISEYNKKFLLQKYPSTDPGKVLVTHLGVDCERKSPPRQLAAPDKSTFVIITVGRLEPVKNHRFLIEACAELKNKGMEFLCLIIGSGSEHTALAGLIVKRGLQREVKLLGFIERRLLSRFYEMADLFVLTSKSEGLPIVLMEAMFNRSVVLAPAMTGIPEIVSEKESGFLFEKENLVSFVDQIIHIKENLSTLDHVRNNARARILKDFDRKKNMQFFAHSMLDSIKKLRAKGA